MITTIIIFLLVLTLLVLVHEWGHYITAKKSGIYVEEFGLGLPPRALGYYKDASGRWVKYKKDADLGGKTMFSLNWIPLGGFVKMKGEDGSENSDEDSFANKRVGTRFKVIVAGVLMNVALAALLFTIGFIVGMPQVVNEGDERPFMEVSEQQVAIVEVLPESPAEAAGFEAGDRLLGVQDENFDAIVPLQGYLSGKSGEELRFMVKRGSEEIALFATPQQLDGAEGAAIGVGLAEVALVSYPWYAAWFYGIEAALKLILVIILGFVAVIQSLVTSGQSVGEVYGPVGIASLVGTAADLGFIYLLQFTATLSVIIAVVNFLPFPALDGGRALFLLIEKIRGKAVNQKIEAVVHNIGFLLLMILVLVVTFKDIGRLLG